MSFPFTTFQKEKLILIFFVQSFALIQGLKNHFFSEQTSETANSDVNSILRYYKLVSKSRFVEIKSINSKIAQKQRAKK